MIGNDNWAGAFFAYQFMSLFFVIIAAGLCYLQPLASGGGISEIKAFLNGVNLNQFVNVRIVVAKILGVSFAIGAGLPIGKKGPLIQIGSIIATIISQGKSEMFKLDLSWTKVQDFRNDQTKRDFVTYGTAAGVAAGFKSPIGGVLFALEEGASFWSSTLTIRTFFCALVTMITLTIILQANGMGASDTADIFVFGQFKDLKDDKTNYRTYELFIFLCMGITGGFIGALFNHLHLQVTNYSLTHWTSPEMKVLRVILFTILMSCVSFILPLMWQKCTPLPTDEETADWSDYELQNLDHLVQYQCDEGEYNQLASLYFVNSNQCLQQLFHFREYKGSSYTSFTLGPLFLFFVSYFIMTILTGGLAVPMGLFIPSLVAGAAYGRIWGHILNVSFSDSFADSGTYALMGAAAINGGVTRITLAMTIIMLETIGNMTYLLPLMITFGAARYGHPPSSSSHSCSLRTLATVERSSTMVSTT
jgi:chloride channel 7